MYIKTGLIILLKALFLIESYQLNHIVSKIVIRNKTII